MRTAIARNRHHRIPESGRLLALALAIIALSILTAPPAHAAFHAMVIEEVFVGPPSDGIARPVPLTADQKAQYVMLRMMFGGQNFVAGTMLRVEDADGNILGSFGNFALNVANDGGVCSYPGCPTIIMGTQAARNMFTFGFNRIVNGQVGRVALPRDAGRVCYVMGTSLVDCVAWGDFDCTRSLNCFEPNGMRNDDFSANGCDTDFGRPAPVLEYGKVLLHAPTVNCGDKANDVEYSLQFPHPSNNAGMNNNIDDDGDGLINQLDCNDGSTAFLWPATEVQNDQVTGAPLSTLTWDSQAAIAGSGVTYDVVNGSLAMLNGFSDAACLASNLPATSTTHGSVPSAGAGYWFLERAGTGPGCVGTYGSGFNPANSRDPVLDPICP